MKISIYTELNETLSKEVAISICFCSLYLHIYHQKDKQSRNEFWVDNELGNFLDYFTSSLRISERVPTFSDEFKKLENTSRFKLKMKVSMIA